MEWYIKAGIEDIENTLDFDEEGNPRPYIKLG